MQYDRQIKPVWEAMERKEFKVALKLCNAAMNKNPI